MSSTTTEYRLSRHRARTQDDEEGGGARADGDQPAVLAAGSQRIDARVALPAVDSWSTFDAETAEIDLPELAVPRTQTEPMPADELERLLADKDLDNAATLSGFAGSPALRPRTSATIDPMPVASIAFGDHQILIVYRADAVELIVPGGARLIAPRAAAAALAEALLRRH